MLVIKLLQLSNVHPNTSQTTMTVLRLKTIEMIISSTAGEAWVLNQFQNCILDHFFFSKRQFETHMFVNSNY